MNIIIFAFFLQNRNYSPCLPSWESMSNFDRCYVV